MDPVNHGLVGAAAGLSILAASRPGASSRTRWAALLCGFVAGEVPDADRLIDACLRPYGCDGQGLAYMLYHRGPSHTLLACLLVVPLLAWLTKALARRVSPPFSLLVAIAAAGILLHLAMDAMNDYGVHPFYPLSQRWFYGDFLFLAEPTVGTALLPYILAMFGLKGRRLLGVCALLGAVGFPLLVVLHQWLMPFGAALAGLWLLAQALLQRRGPRPGSAWASLLLVLTTFFVASRVARARAVQWTAELAPGQSVTDVVTTPAPANPFCWRVISVVRARDSFVARLGVKSLWPSLVAASTCFSPPHGAVPRSARGLEPPPRPEPDPADIRELAEFSGSFAEFERFAQDPRVAATRHFLRVPFWGKNASRSSCEPANAPSGSSGGELLIGDLRVDYDPNDVANFCKYPFTPGHPELYHQLMPVGDPPFFH